MSIREVPRWEDTVPRRRARVMAVVAVVVGALTGGASGVVLERRANGADTRLNAACQDNQARAYGAALRANDTSASEAEAVAAGREYVKEVRLTPECFEANVQADAEAVARAIKGGGRPNPKYPVGVQ